MPNYIRNWVPGGTYFFTVNLLERKENDLLVREVDLLRESVRTVKAAHPFEIIAWVALPEHMHCIWKLPEGDSDFARRWRGIRSLFSRGLPKTEALSEVRIKRGERGIWQRRFYEHTIRDDRDLSNHIDYIHFNPVKHGYAKRAADWPHSSFHRFVKEGALALDWAAPPSLEIVE
jgi:putative transposase